MTSARHAFFCEISAPVDGSRIWIPSGPMMTAPYSPFRGLTTMLPPSHTSDVVCCSPDARSRYRCGSRPGQLSDRRGCSRRSSWLSLGSKARPGAKSDAPLAFILFFRLTLMQSPRLAAQGEGLGICLAWSPPLPREDLAFRHGHFDLALEVHLDDYPAPSDGASADGPGTRR